MEPNPKVYGVLIFFGLLGIVIAMAIVIFFPLNCSSVVKEGFAVAAQTTCPSGSVSFHDKDTNLMCCEGTVNGNTCEGTVICTFSANTQKYPSCNNKRKRKYFGAINPFVQQYMKTDYVSKFAQLLQLMANINTQLKSLPPAQISEEDLRICDDLLKEENAWYDDIKTDSKIRSITYQEECMYIFQTLMDTFKNKPLMTNPKIINQQLKAQLCAAN